MVYSPCDGDVSIPLCATIPLSIFRFPLRARFIIGRVLRHSRSTQSKDNLILAQAMSKMQLTAGIAVDESGEARRGRRRMDLVQNKNAGLEL
jgi:hypothetical protein